eukprot:TRINITY_DN2460_c0_g2_i3.p1 TRINITY_DN2460_c0_g2~~TRINITY_DN2460_c0_g2_i3.p1  ORF type:complete len:1982 (-),score=576.45 TRINITY_DN2460_c0_g2_i3:67-6012(-)
MGSAASLSAKALKRYRPSQLSPDASSASNAPAPAPDQEGKPAGANEKAKAPTRSKARQAVEESKRWTVNEMRQLDVPQLVRWLEALRTDLAPAIPMATARLRLWQEIEKSRPPALEQIQSPQHLDHWPLPETLRWLEYFNALDESVVDKEKLVRMLLEHGEDLPAPNFLGESAEDEFLTQVQRHVAQVKQAATTIIAQLAEETAQVDARERAKHSWHYNGKAVVNFKQADFETTEKLDIPFTDLTQGERVDLTVHEASGWAWVVSEGEKKQGWVPANTIVEIAVTLQDYGEGEDPDEGTMMCRMGEELQVVMRHYSGWTLCRREAPTGKSPAPEVAPEEGWLPDSCLSDHPRNLATKQQHLIQSALHRLATDATGVENTFFRLRTQGASDNEEDSLETLHAKVCALAEEYGSIVAAIQAQPMMLGQSPKQEKQSAGGPQKENQVDPLSLGLPEWVRVDSGCYYYSKSQQKLMSVTIVRVCEVRKQILVTFDADKNSRKIVNFAEFANLKTCPLQPKDARRRRRRKHKKGETSAAIDADEAAQDELAEDLRGMMKDLGPEGNMASADSGSDSDDSSSDVSSTSSAGLDQSTSQAPSGPHAARQGQPGSRPDSGLSTAPTSIGTSLSAGAEEQEEQTAEGDAVQPEEKPTGKEDAAAVQIQAAYRQRRDRIWAVQQLAKCSTGKLLNKCLEAAAAAPLPPDVLSDAMSLSASEPSMPAAPPAPPSAERCRGAAMQVQSCLRRYLAQACLAAAAARAEAEAARAAARAAEELHAVQTMQSMVRRFQARAVMGAMRRAAEESDAVKVMQSIVRQFQATHAVMVAARAAEELKAVKTLQSAARQFQARQDLLVLREWQDWTLLALEWQRASKRFFARRHLVETEAALRHGAAVRLQTLFRGFWSRRELARLKARRDGLLHLPLKCHNAVRLFQRCARRYNALLALQAAERFRIRRITRIQGLWRAGMVRQAHAAEFAEWREVRGQAASRLRSWWLGMEPRERLAESKLLRSAAAQWVQTCWRRHKAMQVTKELRRRQAENRAALRIERCWHGFETRKRIRPQIKQRALAARRIQGLLHMKRAQRQAEQLRQELAARREAAAIQVQRHARGVLKRREVVPKLQARRLAALRWQCFWRKHLAKQRVEAMRQQRAALRVQTAWRSHMAKAEAMRRRAQIADDLLKSLSQGEVPVIPGSGSGSTPRAAGTPRSGGGSSAWLKKVTAALEWKAKRDQEEEEKELRQRRADSAASLHTEAVTPESLAAAAVVDRALAAAAAAKGRSRLRMRALLQTQGNVGALSFSYDAAVCKALAVDHSVLLRLSADDAVAEVANLVQTAWAIAAACRSANPPGGAAPALQVLTSGLKSLKKRLQVDDAAAGRISTADEDSAAMAMADLEAEPKKEAEQRAVKSRTAVMQPLREELQAALSDGKEVTVELKAAVAKVKPEVEALRKKHKEDAEKAVQKLKEEREQKHAQTVALHQIAISTQIEKERLEAGMVDKGKPKLACYSKVYKAVKELQHQLKDLEVSGTANRKSQGILAHTLRALESRAGKAESDARAKLIFGEEEQDIKNFEPSAQVLKKQERSAEQEVQFREALASEISSLRVELAEKNNFEAASFGAKLRAEAEEIGKAATAAEQRIATWKRNCEAQRPWLAEVVPIAKTAASLLAASEFIKACKSPDAQHKQGAGIRALLKRLPTMAMQVEKAVGDKDSPRDQELTSQHTKLKSELRALAELKAAYPDVKVPSSPKKAAAPKDDAAEDSDGAADREAVSSAARPSVSTSKTNTPKKPSPSANNMPPFPPPATSPDGSRSASPPPPEPGEGETDTPREESTPLRVPGPPPPRPPPRSGMGGMPAGAASLGGLSSGLAELGQGLSALSSTMGQGLSAAPGRPGARPSSAAGSRPAAAALGGALKKQQSAAAERSAERSDKVGAPLRSAVRPSSAAGSRGAQAGASMQSLSAGTAAGGSAMKAVQKARNVSTGWA